MGDWFDRFAVWDGLHPDLETLLIYGVGIALYTALVFAFYHNISRRDPFHSRERRGWWGRVVRGAETTLTFPVLSFGYFAVLSLALFVLAKSERATADILLLSMACVMGVRFSAHVSEAMADDLAKLLPLGLLAVVVVDPGHLTLLDTLRRFGETVSMAPVLLQYFALFIVVEAVLRGLRALFPGLQRAMRAIERRRHLSKNAMLRDIESDHEHAFRREKHHEHGTRDRSKDFMMLDEATGGKPGSRQGVGPAIRRELHAGKTQHGGHARRSAPKAGPGGSGGKLSSW